MSIVSGFLQMLQVDGVVLSNLKRPLLTSYPHADYMPAPRTTKRTVNVEKIFRVVPCFNLSRSEERSLLALRIRPIPQDPSCLRSYLVARRAPHRFPDGHHRRPPGLGGA